MHYKTGLVTEPKVCKPRDNEIASKTLPCEHCGQMYKTIAGLRDHKKVEHPKDGRRPVFACGCGKTFSNYASRRYHIKMVHLDEKKYRCEYCAKRFFTPSTLKTHMAVHLNAEEGRPYKCDLCEQRFVARYKLKAHIENVHLCKTVVCIVCQQQFRSQNQLRMHMRCEHNDD
jgi:KRAB domain-containing zinc finger protein